MYLGDDGVLVEPEHHFRCTYRVVWCPKYRRGVLTGPVETRLKEILRVVAAGLRVDIVVMKVMPDLSISG